MTEAKTPRVFQRLYRHAKRPEDLPWYRPEPPPLLVEAMERQREPGRALDVGCGAGTNSVYMAEQGWAVTGVDLMPQAIDMLRGSAAEKGLHISAVQANILDWQAEEPFDLVLDVGCLHSLAPRDRPAYRKQLLRWLAPDGDFILIHCGRRGWWDSWPLGPRRVARDKVVELFSPELSLREYAEVRLDNMPWFVGRSALAGRYWFHRQYNN